MNKEEFKKFLLNAPHPKVVQYIETVHPVDILDVLRENEKYLYDILGRLAENYIA